MQRGFSLLETLIALVLVGIAMTALLLIFVGSGQYGVIGRRQANAVTLACSLANQLSHANWSETTTGRLVNNNTANDTLDSSGTPTLLADPNALFAAAALPTGTDAADGSLGTFAIGGESYDAYVNVAPIKDPNNNTVEMGRMIAVIVRYHVGTKFMRAVALGYRYNPTAVGVGQLPL